MQYNYTAGQNNGKIASAVNYNLSGEQVVYTYDSLNRLIQAQTAANPSVTQWGQAYVYDGFGNLYQKNVTKGSAPSMSYSVYAPTNQLYGLGYDANGNVTYPPTGGPLTYDFLNRVVTAPNGVAYSYDASNRRVWKLNANGEAYYLYDLNGENLGTFTPQMGVDPTKLYLQPVAWQERAYFFGKKLFVTEDNVGSALASSPSPRSFYPYGEPKSGTAATEQYAFATYWEDSETGLDYAMNRYYSSGLGRFLSTDPDNASISLRDPQSWNRYTYVENDPVNKNDPTGLEGAGPPSGCTYLGVYYPICPNLPGPSKPAPADPTGLSPRQAYQAAQSAQLLVKLGYMTDCQGLAALAQYFADQSATTQQFVNDFGVLTPKGGSSVAGIAWNSNPVYLNLPGESSGYQTQFQNTVPDNPTTGWNGDQGHHFAAFFEFGFKYGNLLGGTLGSAAGAVTAFALEYFQGPTEGNVLNQGDINLGVAAAELGSALASGNASMSDIPSAIQNLLCSH